VVDDFQQLGMAEEEHPKASRRVASDQVKEDMPRTVVAFESDRQLVREVPRRLGTVAKGDTRERMYA
jgi:hypothetical protein